MVPQRLKDRASRQARAPRNQMAEAPVAPCSKYSVVARVGVPRDAQLTTNGHEEVPNRCGIQSPYEDAHRRIPEAPAAADTAAAATAAAPRSAANRLCVRAPTVGIPRR